MKYFVLIITYLFFYFGSNAQSSDASKLSFDTLRIPGYIINTSGRSCFFMPCDNRLGGIDGTVGKFLNKYFSGKQPNWTPKCLESEHVFMFNPGKKNYSDVNLSDINIFDDYEFRNMPNKNWEILNTYAAKQILPNLSDSFQFIKRDDESDKKYNVYFLDGIWIKIALDSKRHESPTKTQSTIRPSRNESYYYCYVLIGYYSFGLINDLNDSEMIRVR